MWFNFDVVAKFHQISDEITYLNVPDNWVSSFGQCRA